MKNIYGKLLLTILLGFGVQQLRAQCPVTIDSYSSQNACFGQNDGEATVTVSGGDGPTYYYELQQVAGAGSTLIDSQGGVTSSSYTFQNVSPGNNYRILVVSGSCKGAQTNLFNIGENTQITLDQTLADIAGNTRCTGTPDGSIDLGASVSGSVGPYEYSLDNGPFVASTLFTELTHANYKLTVRDAQGCTEDFILMVPDGRVPPTAAITPANPEACASVDLLLNGSPTGGTEPYASHSWTGDVGFLSATNVVDPTFNSATPGTYNLTYEVTDDKGCTATSSVTVTVVDPTVVSLIVDEDDPTICAGESTSITVRNAQAGYRYQLRNDADNSPNRRARQR